MTADHLSALIVKLREERPLVHNMTNVVVTNFTANGLLALGASPVMAYAREEVAGYGADRRGIGAKSGHSVCRIGRVDDDCGTSSK